MLPGISTEQLRSRLNRMVADGLLTRQRYREVPPRVDYELTERARDLMPVLGALARWGYRWSWSAPRPARTIDIGAILRLAPGLLSPPRLVRRDDRGLGDRRGRAARTYVLTAGGGRVLIEERAAPEAEARIAGSESEWIEALGPQAERGGLTITGNARLVDAVLDGFGTVAKRSNANAA